MVQIKSYNQTVQANNIGQTYIYAGNTHGAFGEYQAAALKNFAQAQDRAYFMWNEIQEHKEQTKAVELKNSIYSEWEQPKLYAQDGYFNTLGKNASGRSQDVLKDYAAFVEQKKKDLGIKGLRANRIADYVISDTYRRLSKDIMSHDLRQTQEAQKNEAQLLIQNTTQQGINDRNSDDDVYVGLLNIKNAVNVYADSANLDETQKKLLLNKSASDYFSAIISKCADENNLQARKLLDKYSDFINPDTKLQLDKIVKNTENRVLSRDLASNIVANSTSEREAIKKAEAIDDIEMSDAVLSRVKQYYSQQEHLKNAEQKEALNSFYNKVIKVSQNGGTMSLDDIPNNLDPQTKLSLMNYINKNGSPTTDDEIWENLYKMQVNNAQGFANEDLNKYRGFLSDGEYKQFLKAQEEIRAGKFYSNIKDDNAMIDAALKEMKLHKGKKEDVAYSEIRAMVREFEARKGRKITDDELLNITQSLGYKDENNVKLYKQIEKGMADRTGFIRDVMNDFVYYQNQHGGQMPPDEEKYKIIQKRVRQKAQEKSTEAQELINTIKTNAALYNNQKNITSSTPIQIKNGNIYQF